jgi:hypothetical protein
MRYIFLLMGSLLLTVSLAGAQVAGRSIRNNLIIAADGKTTATIVLAPELPDGSWEARTAADLAKYIEMMTGAKPALANTAEAAAAALRGQEPVLLVGTAAVKAEPGLTKALNEVAKKAPTLRADAIVLRRAGNRVYLAGTNDESHYYAVSALLHQWGCRWYLPTAFGECIPTHARLEIGELNYRYAPPFEVRNSAAGYAWLGDTTGRAEFMRRNMMNELRVPCGHDLGKYVRDLVPEGGSIFNVPIVDEATIEHVTAKTEEFFAAGKDFSLGMNDGAYASDSKIDAALSANLHDKYFLGQMLTDNFMTLYNGVARNLQEKYPDSPSRIGIFAYVNITMPPQRDVKAEKPLVAYLAPIDIDPNHGMDDIVSPPKQEYREILYRWSKVMDGRVIIYDYDQGMLVWRDLPNPSHQAFRQDIKHYRDAGILGMHTETRGAYATVFLNLYLRGQLVWNPDADVDALLAEFYPKFYGPAAEPMRRYWEAIYRAWDVTIVTEHEFYTIPAIYTEALVKELRGNLTLAQQAVAPLRARDAATLSRNERLYLERMTFTEHSFQVIENYVAMVRATATDAEYAKAVQAGERALAAREALAKLNGILTSTRMENGYAWFPGEVTQYRELQAMTDGTNGTLITRLPLEWAFRRDPNDTGLARGFAYQPAVDLSFWKANKAKFVKPALRKNYPTTEWEMLRTDLYAQAQGVLHPDWQSFSGFLWYRTDVELSNRTLANPVRVYFPGLFGEAWLYINGNLVAHRDQHSIWWHNDYQFNWDVDVSGALNPGANTITLRVSNPHHNGGLFRRPFLYSPIAILEH